MLSDEKKKGGVAAAPATILINAFIPLLTGTAFTTDDLQGGQGI